MIVFLHQTPVLKPYMKHPFLNPLGPMPRRSTRSTKGKPPERYRNIYAFDTIVDMGPHYICPCD